MKDSLMASFYKSGTTNTVKNNYYLFYPLYHPSLTETVYIMVHTLPPIFTCGSPKRRMLFILIYYVKCARIL